MENFPRVFQKQKGKKKHTKRLSFITQFKIEFLLSFTSCKKVLGKMPECIADFHHPKKFKTTKHNINFLM